ncbi:MAG: hypothetical protein A2X36_03160 [Elusimicrobia bacterium GWA2_69_24]|nr:MAG: hypothetical protein A2X36_03160 [Elusimicrobia bacterium GWA2_69_24]HBL15233.1 hypothetical protein [Elusimicrobiota bacterium]
MIEWRPLIAAILRESPRPAWGLHGVPHWARVLENGLRLASETGADVRVIGLFAVFHDCRRVNDDRDPGHGARGAELAGSCRGRLFALPDPEFALLTEACIGHTDGRTEGDVTLRTCWDADRLDLGRVGIRPDPRRLCTEAAKRPDILGWAEGRAAAGFIPERVRRDWGLERGPGA